MLNKTKEKSYESIYSSNNFIKGNKTNMKKKIISYLSYGTLIIGSVIGIFALVNIYIIKSKLPSGICPVTSNKPLIYIAIALCCISFILSFFEPRVKEKAEQ